MSNYKKDDHYRRMIVLYKMVSTPKYLSVRYIELVPLPFLIFGSPYRTSDLHGASQGSVQVVCKWVY